MIMERIKADNQRSEAVMAEKAKMIEDRRRLRN